MTHDPATCEVCEFEHLQAKRLMETGPCGRVQIQGEDGKLHDAVWDWRKNCYSLPRSNDA